MCFYFSDTHPGSGMAGLYVNSNVSSIFLALKVKFCWVKLCVCVCVCAYAHVCISTQVCV